MSQTILHFTSSNHRRTYIAPDNVQELGVYYKVKTTGESPNEVTSIYRRSRTLPHHSDDLERLNNESDDSELEVRKSDDLIASVEWKYPHGDDILRLGDSDALPQKLDKWLKRAALSTVPRTFTAWNKVNYKWTFELKGSPTYKLFPKDRGPAVAVVTMPDGRHRQITIEPQGLEILDDIIVSFVLVLNSDRLLEGAFLDQSAYAFDLTDSKILSWGRSRSKSILTRISNNTSSSHTADAESIYASSTTGLLR